MLFLGKIIIFSNMVSEIIENMFLRLHAQEIPAQKKAEISPNSGKAVIFYWLFRTSPNMAFDKA